MRRCAESEYYNNGGNRRMAQQNTQNIVEQLKNATEGLNQCLELAEKDDWWMKGIWYWTSQIALLRESLRYALKDDE